MFTTVVSGTQPCAWPWSLLAPVGHHKNFSEGGLFPFLGGWSGQGEPVVWRKESVSHPLLVYTIHDREITLKIYAKCGIKAVV